MNTTKFIAPDIECDGCANAIRKSVGRLAGVVETDVDVDAKAVTVRHESTVTAEALRVALDRAGFPVAS